MSSTVNLLPCQVAYGEVIVSAKSAVVNGASFGLAAWLVPGFSVHGLGPAVLGALVVSVVSWFLGFFTGERRDDRR